MGFIIFFFAMDEDVKWLLQKLVTWTKLKLKIHILQDTHLVYFHEREIWWCSLGINIGYEQNGKNQYFERPVLVVKKFNRYLLWAVPLTSKQKSGKFYYETWYEGKKYSIILSQMRAISSKRLLRKIRTVPQSEFTEVKKQIKLFL
ncbi:MAG: type II toxin-antitoxin system PemK/MazF family toxin [Candidatus Kerfeldbacteria bacterium]|nr:type II toxin-antitoxin system PemK/MazF family toxin [Candidatus Kerfeldbacteria bacterium]